MDVKRVENSLINSALPTAAVAAGAGIVGYMTPKMVDKSGNLDPYFHAYNAGNLLQSDVVQLSDAVYLDSINPYITEEEINALNHDHDKVFKFAEKKMKNANKALENFVAEHAEELDIKPKDGQRLKDAVKEFLKDKDAQAVKDIMFPNHKPLVNGYKPIEHVLADNMHNPKKYLESVRETFNEVFDASTKKFKEGADKETVEFFKKSLRNLKMQNAKTYALVGGGFAFAGALIANLLHSDKNS